MDEFSVEMKSEDVGGTLISLLSEGLYTNPLHAIREYVQNSIDAGASEVVIKLTGSMVNIRDNGCGMNLEELIQARQVGISKKDYHEFVGFRGIGIYAGFGLCNRLVIVTQKEGEDYEYGLTFDFKGMRDRIAEERKDRSKVTSLTDLITRYSRFEKKRGDPSQHYTIVMLEDVAKPYIHRLYNVDELRKYLLRNVPVDFHDDFPHKKEIVERLSRLPGYHAAQIRIQAEGREDVLVAKPPIPDLSSPQMGTLRRPEDGKEIAFYWWCQHTQRQKIPDEYADYRGFVYKLKGFTIGDQSLLRRSLKRGGGILYEWVVGEIYVLDEEIVPNAERDDFQAGPAKEILNGRVEEFLREVEKEVDQRRAEARANVVLKEVKQRLDEIGKALDAGDISTDYMGLLSEVGRLESEIGKQKRNLPSSQKGEAEALRRRAEQFKKQIWAQITSPSLSPRRRVRHRREETTAGTPEMLASPLSSISPVERSLTQVVEEAGWSVSECETLLGIIDRVLRESLDGEIYQGILERIGEMLGEEG